MHTAGAKISFFIIASHKKRNKMARKNRWANSSSHISTKRNYRIPLPGNTLGAQSHLGTSYKEKHCLINYSKNYVEQEKIPLEDLLF